MGGRPIRRSCERIGKRPENAKCLCYDPTVYEPEIFDFSIISQLTRTSPAELRGVLIVPRSSVFGIDSAAWNQAVVVCDRQNTTQSYIINTRRSLRFATYVPQLCYEDYYVATGGVYSDRDHDRSGNPGDSRSYRPS
jgi:hypothetical protein